MAHGGLQRNKGCCFLGGGPKMTTMVCCGIMLWGP